LKELSTALGDDADFAGSMTTLVSETKTALEGKISSESQASEAARKELDSNFNEIIKASDEAQNKADAAIIEAVGYNDRGDASASKYNDYAAETEKAFADSGDTEFYPVNEANFQAWLDVQAEIARKGLDSNFNEIIKASDEAQNKADAAIIEAVGYMDRGDASASEFSDYQAEISQAIEADGGSDFAPINEVNFEAWKHAKLNISLEEEVKRATAAENALDGKVKEIISNTDVQSLDSFSEVEKGVNDGFAMLRAMVLEVANNSVEINFGALAADGTQVLFAGYPTKYPKVFVNGILQEEGVDYTKAATVDGKGNTASDITFAAAPVAGAKVMVLGVESAHIAEDRYETPVVFEGGPEA
jgi:hypothetical protein